MKSAIVILVEYLAHFLLKEVVQTYSLVLYVHARKESPEGSVTLVNLCFGSWKQIIPMVVQVKRSTVIKTFYLTYIKLNIKV